MCWSPHAEASSLLTHSAANIHLYCYYSALPDVDQRDGAWHSAEASDSLPWQQDEEDTLGLFCRHEAHLIYSCMFLPQDVSFLCVLSFIYLYLFCVEHCNFANLVCSCEVWLLFFFLICLALWKRVLKVINCIKTYRYASRGAALCLVVISKSRATAEVLNCPLSNEQMHKARWT